MTESPSVTPVQAGASSPQAPCVPLETPPSAMGLAAGACA